MVKGEVAHGRSACVAFSMGCLRSQLNAGRLVEYFQRNGWTITTQIAKADIVLVGTCGFQQMCEDISIRYTAIADRKKPPHAPLVVFGCLPGINPKRLSENFACLALTGKNSSQLDELIGARVKLAQVEPPHDLKEYERKYRECFTCLDKLIANFELSKRYAGECASVFGLPVGNQRLLDQFERVFNIKLADGCKEQCSYCAIRLAEGELCSRSEDKILVDLAAGLAEGYQVFNLVGTDVGAWGQDLGTNVADLLGRMVQRPEPFRILFSDFHPRWLVHYFDQLLPLFVEHPAKFGFLGFPIQSGSDRVLALMRRDYRIAAVEKALVTLQQATPDVRLITHILVGFPGETEEDFEQTLAFVKKVKFERVSLYMYSDRPGTAASNLPDKVPSKVVRNRFQRFRREFRSIIG